MNSLIEAASILDPIDYVVIASFIAIITTAFAQIDFENLI